MGRTRSSRREHGRTPPPRSARLRVEQLEDRNLPSATASIIPGELLVSFKLGVSQAGIGRFYTDHGFTEREALDRYASANGPRLKLVSVPAARTQDLIAVLERDPRVAYAEPNYLFSNVSTALTPSDPFYIQEDYLDNIGQWSLTPDADIDASEAWRITTGSPDVLVAVIDTGVDYNHPELAANMWTNPFETPGDGIDNDGNGFVDDIHGYDFVNNDGDPMDDRFHGTAVAGVLGASPFNEGVVGVAWRVGIVAVKVVSAQDTLKTSDAVQAIQYVNYLKHVQGQNIVVTNNSYVLDQTAAGPLRALRDAMAGLDQPGMSPILHVAAAGNSNKNNDLAPTYPASYDLDNIISVAATDGNDQYADFSNYGPTSVDLAAPGAFIHTTYPNNGYAFGWFGSSFAAPQVTGAAALVASAFPDLTAAQIKQRILVGVDPIGHIGDNSLKPTLTKGRLNVANALAGAALEKDNKPPAAIGSLMAAGASFQSVTLTWTATGNDGSNGRAGFYDVRYATSPITNATWATATRLLGEPGPKPSGDTESLSVSGLDPATNYYFAIKVRDNMGSESALSNVAQATTAPAATLFHDNMENGVNGWASTGLWHQSTGRASSPTTSWYYGDEATTTYNTGHANKGELISPTIHLQDAVNPVLIYREWRQVEDVPLVADSSRVQIKAGDGPWTTVTVSEFTTTVEPRNWQDRAELVGWNVPLPRSTPEWVSGSIDLSPYVGQTIRIRFAFDSRDTLFNNYEGWYIDDVCVFDEAESALRASGGESAPSPGGPDFTRLQTAPGLAEALARWQSAGAGATALHGLDLRIANLGDTTLGPAGSNSSWLSANAGRDWPNDPTPDGRDPRAGPAASTKAGLRDRVFLDYEAGLLDGRLMDELAFALIEV